MKIICMSVPRLGSRFWDYFSVLLSEKAKKFFGQDVETELSDKATISLDIKIEIDSLPPVPSCHLKEQKNEKEAVARYHQDVFFGFLYEVIRDLSLKKKITLNGAQVVYPWLGSGAKLRYIMTVEQIQNDEESVIK